MRNALPRTLRLVAAGILLTGGVVSTAAAVSPPSTTAAATTAVQAPALPSKVPAGALDTTGYWTAEKLKNAIPADLPSDAATPAKQGRPRSTTTTRT